MHIGVQQKGMDIHNCRTEPCILISWGMIWGRRAYEIARRVARIGRRPIAATASLR